MNGRPKILFVDDEKSFFDEIRGHLQAHYQLIYAPTAAMAEKSIQVLNYDLVLTDLVLREGVSAQEGGLKLIKILKQYRPNIPIIAITKYDCVANVVEAMKNGAVDFFKKEQYNIENWRQKIDQYLKNTQRESQAASKNKIKDSSDKPFIGESKAIKAIKRILERLSTKPDVTVIITGETGVGKEVAAQYLHNSGVRSGKPFIAVNLSTLTKSIMESRLFGHRKGAFTDAKEDSQGIFEKANGGILFLDEIGEIDLDMQVKLLRFLQEKVITPIGGNDILLDVQIVVATNKDLRVEVKEGRFRQDLFFRLYQFQLEIPPLRDRRDDLKLLLEYYLHQEKESAEIIEESVKSYLLEEYPWPGNIRELVNWVRSACLKKEMLDLPYIDKSLLPRDIDNKSNNTPAVFPDRNTSIAEIDNWQANAAFQELKPIEDALTKYGKKQLAGKEVELSLDQMRYKVKKYFDSFPELFDRLPTIKQKYKLS